MPRWNYTARTVGGETRRDQVELPSREEVVAYLRRQRLIPVSIREAPTEIRFSLGSRVKLRDVVVFTRQFATMINAGLPLVKALDILGRQSENEAFRGNIQQILYDVESGSTLAQAMRKHQKVFTPLYVNMVEAGEQGGILDTILNRLAVYLEKQDALVRKLKGAMIYPSVILAAAVGAVAILMIFVIPTFRDMFAAFNQDLPLPTQLVLGLSVFLRENVLWLAGGLGLAGVGFYRWIQTEDGRRAFDRFLLELPVIGDLIQKAAIARFTRTLGTLLNSGVAILTGLEITASTAGNTVVRDAVLDSRSAIAGGESIAPPLEKTGVFPPMVTLMIHVGEESGELADMLEKIADFYDDEVDVAVEAMLKIIEPVLLVVMGVVLGGIIIAMYLPIFQIVTTVQ